MSRAGDFGCRAVESGIWSRRRLLLVSVKTMNVGQYFQVWVTIPSRPARRRVTSQAVWYR
jgi:hypothetical protein